MYRKDAPLVVSEEGVETADVLEEAVEIAGVLEEAARIADVLEGISLSADGAPPMKVLTSAQTLRMPLITEGRSTVVFKNCVWFVFSKL